MNLNFDAGKPRLIHVWFDDFIIVSSIQFVIITVVNFYIIFVYICMCVHLNICCSYYFDNKYAINININSIISVLISAKNKNS